MSILATSSSNFLIELTLKIKSHYIRGIAYGRKVCHVCVASSCTSWLKCRSRYANDINTMLLAPMMFQRSLIVFGYINTTEEIC